MKDLLLFLACVALGASIHYLGFKSGYNAALRWVDEQLDEQIKELDKIIQENETRNNQKD